jgi:hypothetical protein
VVLFKQTEKKEGNMEVKKGHTQQVSYEDVEAGALIWWEDDYYIAGEDETAMSVSDGTLQDIDSDALVTFYPNACIVI